MLGRCQIETVLLCTGHLSDCVVTRLHHITCTECQVVLAQAGVEIITYFTAIRCIYLAKLRYMLDIFYNSYSRCQNMMDIR